MVLKDHELRQIDEAYLERLKAKDPDALLKLSVKLANDLKAAMERLNQNPGNSSRPSGSFAAWDKPGQDDDDDLPPPGAGGSTAGRGKDESEKTEADGENARGKTGKASGRKPGRQPGSPGFGRSQKFEICETQHHYPEYCAGCNGALPADKSTAVTGFDTVDVEFGDAKCPGLHLTCVAHRYYQTTCPCCGLENRAMPKQEPENALWGKTQLSEWRLVGPALAALIVYLSLDMRITRRKVRRLLLDLFGLELSMGTIQNCLVESGRALEPLEEQIVQEVLEDALVHADETGHNESGVSLWLWVFVTSSTVLYLIGRRSQELFANLLDACEGSFDGWLMSDGYGVYLSACGHAQAGRHDPKRLHCWAHLVRKARGLCDSYSPPSQQFGQQVPDTLNHLMEAVYQAREGPDRGTASIAAEHQAQLDFLKLRCKTMRQFGHRKTRALAVEFLNDWTAIFRVLERPAWPLTNNEAERALRHWVILRRMTQGTRSEQGSRSLGLIASVLETCRLRAASPLLYIRDVIHHRRQGKKAPPLPLKPGLPCTA